MKILRNDNVWVWLVLAMAQYRLTTLTSLIMLLGIGAVLGCAADDGENTTIPDRYTAFIEYPYPDFAIDITPSKLMVHRYYQSDDQTTAARTVELYAGRTPELNNRRYFLISRDFATGYIIVEFGTTALDAKSHLESVIERLDDCYQGKINGRSQDIKDVWVSCVDLGSVEDKAHGSLKIQMRKAQTGQLEFLLQMIDYRPNNLIKDQDINKLRLDYSEFGKLLKILAEIQHPEMKNL